MSSEIPCRYFMNTGKCFYGDDCNFSHAIPNKNKQQPANAQAAQRSRTSGKNYHQSTTIPSVPVAVGGGTRRAGGRHDRPCRNILAKGSCPDSNCRFNHDVAQYVYTSGTNELVTLNTNASVDESDLGAGLSLGELAAQIDNVHAANDGRHRYVQQRGALITNPHDGAIISGGDVLLPMAGKTGVSFAPGYDPSRFQEAANHIADIQINHQGGTTYFGSQETKVVPMKPVIATQGPSVHDGVTTVGVESFSTSQSIKEEIIRENEAKTKGIDEEEDRTEPIPGEVSHYHSLVPLDDCNPIAMERRASRAVKVFPFSSSTFKCVDSQTGEHSCLRRIDGFIVGHEFMLKASNAWTKLDNCPHLVALREAIVSRDLGFDHKTFGFVYDYIPGAKTLEETYLSSPSLLPESLLWHIAMQILAGLRIVHRARLACRCLDPSKVLLAGGNRVLISGVGILDVVLFGEDTGRPLQQMQNEDLFSLGGLLLSLGCGNPSAVQTPPQSVEFLSEHYSTDLKNFVISLMTVSTTSPNYPCAEDMVRLATPHLLDEYSTMTSLSNTHRNMLSKEVQNGRLFRLACKLGYINERPEFEGDHSWSETGDRYLLKLFRDFVFHQVDEEGKPIVDYGHVVDSLNRLDAGSLDRVTLTSRDGSSVLVVSYSDLKNCVAEAFAKLSGDSGNSII